MIRVYDTKNKARRDMKIYQGPSGTNLLEICMNGDDTEKYVANMFSGRTNSGCPERDRKSDKMKKIMHTRI